MLDRMKKYHKDYEQSLNLFSKMSDICTNKYVSYNLYTYTYFDKTSSRFSNYGCLEISSFNASCQQTCGFVLNGRFFYCYTPEI